jgi:hypothetical protein
VSICPFASFIGARILADSISAMVVLQLAKDNAWAALSEVVRGNREERDRARELPAVAAAALLRGSATARSGESAREQRKASLLMSPHIDSSSQTEQENEYMHARDTLNVRPFPTGFASGRIPGLRRRDDSPQSLR